MLFRSYSRLLVLALTFPEMSHALGLGNMRVESRLDEPVSAQIDILGATPDELKGIRASVASPEVFARYHAERPPFLSSAIITVGTDAAGKPVLNIQSSEAFTEPLVEFLIDLHWGKGELVRDYSLLLDPAHFNPAVSASAPASPNALSPSVEQTLTEIPKIELSSNAPISVAPALIVQAPAPVRVGAEMQYRVVPHDTLRDIARHAGARSEADLQRAMLAIFRNNRSAFAGNINLLRSGALIDIPSAAEIETFDSVDVEREIRAQMAAWRRGRPSAPRRAMTLSARAQSEHRAVAAPVPQTPGADVAAVVSTVNTLDGRVQFLQQTLTETNRQLAITSARLRGMERAKSATAPAVARAVAVQVQPAKGRTSLSAWLMALALLGGAAVYACRRFLSGVSAPRKPSHVEEPTLEAQVLEDNFPFSGSESKASLNYTVAESVREPVAEAVAVQRQSPVAGDGWDSEATVQMTQVVDIDVNSNEERRHQSVDAPETVVLETLEPKAADAVETFLDYNLSDLDGRAQHVEMPGSLHDHVVVVERRKNVVDTLMVAIQRDPTRYDLRMKLLETLYSAASTNLRAFKEVVRDLASHPEKLKAGEWEHIIAMGRQIAADDILFAERAEDQKIADCA